MLTKRPKTFGVAWAILLLALGSIYGANLLLKYQKLTCPILPWPIADYVQCPELREPPVPIKSADDPRGVLFKEMGITWSEENFWSAVKRGDERAMLLFLRGGMGINPGSLSELLTDPKAIGTATLNALLDFKGRRGDFCATGASVADGMARFVVYAKSERARKFVVSFCSDSRFVEAMVSEADLLEKRLTETNQRSRDGYAKCVARYGNGEVIKKSIDRYFVCTGSDFKEEERQLCDFAGPLYHDDLMANLAGAGKGDFPESSFQRIAQRFCRGKFGDADKGEARRLEDLRSAIKAYRTT